MSSTAISLIITSIYVVTLLLLGFVASRRSNSTMNDYFLAGGQIGWVAFSLTLFATWMSTFAFLGSPGFYYKMGVNWLVPHGFLVVASPFLLWFIGRRLWAIGRKEGHLTPGDYFASQYKSPVLRKLVAVTCLLALVPYCVIQLVGVGKVIDASTGGLVSYSTAVTVTALAILVYSFMGGIRAVIWTDAIQAVLFGAILLGGAGAVVMTTQDIPTSIAMAEKLEPSIANFNPERFGWPITLLVMWGLGYILTPHMWQRVYMTRSPGHLSRGVLVGTILAFSIVAIPSLIIGVMARGNGIEVADTDTLMVAVFSQHAQWLIPLLMVGAVAAGMSTVDSQLLTASSIVARDIAGFTDNASSPFVSKLTLCIGVMLILAVALSSAKDGAIVLLASKGIAVALLLFIPLVGGLIFGTPNKYAAISALLLGGGTLLSFEAGWMNVQIPFGFGPAIAAVVVQLIVFLVAQLVLQRSSLSG